MTLVEQAQVQLFSNLGSRVKRFSFLNLSFLICMLTVGLTVVSSLHA